MYALAINGSPRKKGNTALLLDAVLEPLQQSGWKTELEHIGGKDIHGCRSCYKCMEKQDKKCKYDKDIFNGLMEKILAADALILGTPCYFATVSTEIKALIDRAGFVAFANGGLFQGKIGVGVVAARRGGAIHAYDTMNHLFGMSRMITPGSTYWNMGYGMETDDVSKDTEALANMQHLGRTIAWLGKAIEPHINNYPQ